MRLLPVYKLVYILSTMSTNYVYNVYIVYINFVDI